MTVGGQGIPRLQELAYLETVAKGVANGNTLEEIRLALVDHAWGNLAASPGGDPPDPATYGKWRGDGTKFVLNATDALKELMRLDFVRPAVLPSNATSAHTHMNAKYTLTSAGEQWALQLAADRRQAYDDLIPDLFRCHPKLASFLEVIGSQHDDDRGSLIIPLLRWGQLTGRRSYDAYRKAVGDYVAAALASADLGWSATAQEITTHLEGYLNRILARAQARDRDPFPTVRTFTQTCEEALVTLAFHRAGCSIDYVSMEILRRWCRWLGLASFTYHVPGAYALRFWRTAQIETSHGKLAIQRRIGNAWRDRALDMVFEYCQQARAASTTYVPVWEVRAAVCWKLHIVDDEFDRAVTDMIAGRRGTDRPWRVHLDQVSIGARSSGAPLVLIGASAGALNYNVITVVPKLDN